MVNRYILAFLSKVLISLLLADEILKTPKSVHRYHVRIVQYNEQLNGMFHWYL